MKPEQQKQLQTYHTELLRFNQRVNLISKKTEADADEEHFADCIIGCRSVLDGTTHSTIYDFGSGNGFPGIVLAILAPDRKIVLVDSDSRKAEFLKHITDFIGLKNVEIKCCRVEDLPPATVECAVSRGLASITASIVATRRLFKVDGMYFHFKGAGWMRELANIPVQISSVWAPKLVKEYTLPVSSAQLGVVLTKRIGQQ